MSLYYFLKGFIQAIMNDSNGYDRDGYDSNGYDKQGYDRNGYDRDGYDRSGYNRQGFDKNGYDRQGFDVNGYNRQGFDRFGFNREGFDAEGYDKEGYNKQGYNREGYDRLGYDEDGYDREGYDREGYDRDGYDREGYDREGYSKEENDRRTELQKFYIAKQNYESDPYNAADLAVFYLDGKVVEKDEEKAFDLIVEGAFRKSRKALRLLAYCFNCGIAVAENKVLSNYISALAEDSNPPAIYQYKAMSPTYFKAKSKEQLTAEEEEQKHLDFVIDRINNRISYLYSIMEPEDFHWTMDRDQRQYVIEARNSNIHRSNEIAKFKEMIKRPYYARMDSLFDGRRQTYYIGEEAYYDYDISDANIYSVWSEYGKKYREKNVNKFYINGTFLEVLLRRRIDIANGQLNEIFDEYVAASDYANAQITDPFLIKILEEKKGEKNLTNIIRTIQLNQNDIIEYDFNKNLVVQGCAGSGKTMILLHRLANMKYNIKNLDLSKIKIITPNRKFKIFIDELSKNLGINQIQKMTLEEYYISLLAKYRNEHQEKYYKTVRVKTMSGDTIEQKQYAFRETGPTAIKESQTICNDTDLDFEIVERIYSEQFWNLFKKEVEKEKNKMGAGLDYGTLMSRFNDCFRTIIQEYGYKINSIKNYTCVLYAKVLFAYLYYGAIRNTDELLCIDEGQDISIVNYKLIKEVNNDRINFNIYGDTDQQLPDSTGIGSWDNLDSIIRAKHFILNENYRNSENIVKFYNAKLGKNNKSFGLETKPVQNIDKNKLLTWVRIQLILNNRTAVITNNPEEVPDKVKELCVNYPSRNKAALLSVREAKGLEFDSVFVFDAYMTNSQKYISYTRALSELYIVS